MKPSPERRLPKLLRFVLEVRSAREALVPGQDQVRPEYEVLVEQVGDLRGELEALADISRIRQIAAQRAELRLEQQLRQQAQNLPEHHLAVERRRLAWTCRVRCQYLRAEDLGEWERAVRAYALPLGQFQLQPAGHALALHHNHLRLERRAQRLAQGFRQVLGQGFQSVAGVEP